MKTPNFDEFSRRIEQVVQDHIAECRRTAQGALERAFAAAMNVSPPPVGTSAKVSPAGRERKPGRRRNLAEMAALSDRLHDAVCANPGETMAALATRLGALAPELHRPMARLRRAGKVRHVGARNSTRYFPLTAGSA